MSNHYTTTPPTESGWYWLQHASGTKYPHQFFIQRIGFIESGAWAMRNKLASTNDILSDGYRIGPRILDPDIDSKMRGTFQEYEPSPWLDENRNPIPPDKLPRGFALDLMNLERIVSKSLGMELQDIILEHFEIKRALDTEEISGTIHYQRMGDKQRFVITLTGGKVGS